MQQGMDSHGLGCGSYVKISGKNGREVLITTVYQACKASISTIGSKTAYAQQWHLLRQAGNPKPDRRKSFIIDLDNFLSTHHAAGTEILLMGDFNETLGDSIQGLDAIINKYSLLDLLPYHHHSQLLNHDRIRHLRGNILGNGIATHSRSRPRQPTCFCTVDDRKLHPIFIDGQNLSRSLLLRSKK
jgi:hypothetical protein